MCYYWFFSDVRALTLISDGTVFRLLNLINAHNPLCVANCSKATGLEKVFLLLKLMQINSVLHIYLLPPFTVVHSQSKPRTRYSLQ